MLLSIVIPCLNDAENLQRCLTELAPLRRSDVEVIVVDGGSTDSSVAVARSAADRVIESDPGRARQMNEGARGARGQWLLFLHVDTQLPDDIAHWLDGLSLTAGDWGFFTLHLSGRQRVFRWIEIMISWRSRLTSIATGDQCLFVKRSLFEMLNGFAVIALMEDIELSTRLKKRAHPRVWRSPVTTSSRRWEENGIVATILLMWLLRLAYFFGVSPLRLHRWYYRDHCGREVRDSE